MCFPLQILVSTGGWTVWGRCSVSGTTEDMSVDGSSCQSEGGYW